MITYDTLTGGNREESMLNLGLNGVTLSHALWLTHIKSGKSIQTAWVSSSGEHVEEESLSPGRQKSVEFTQSYRNHLFLLPLFNFLIFCALLVPRLFKNTLPLFDFTAADCKSGAWCLVSVFLCVHMWLKCARNFQKLSTRRQSYKVKDESLSLQAVQHHLQLKWWITPFIPAEGDIYLLHLALMQNESTEGGQINRRYDRLVNYFMCSV